MIASGMGKVDKVDAYSQMYTTTRLNLRVKATTNSKRITTMKKGAKIKVLKTGKSFYRISYNGKTGYCAKRYLSFKKPSTSTAPKGYKRTITLKAYAYTGHSITSTGRRPVVGRTIAVDPRVIPYGSRVYIPALGRTYIAEDCGGAIKGNKIDVYLGSQAACRAFGVKTLKAYILK